MQPLHYAAKSGKAEIIKHLVDSCNVPITVTALVSCVCSSSHSKTTPQITHHTVATQLIIRVKVATVEPRLSKSPLSEPSVIRTLFRILKSQKTVRFSAKPSNKWNAYVIFRLVRPNSYIIVQ